VNAAVTLVVLAVAAGTFVLSYTGVHAVALEGGVSVQLARIYPGLFDALLVIACVAAVVLRDGRWWARCWAWLVVIVVLGAIGVTDVLHAMNYALRHRPTEGVVAAAPVVAVLLAFSLLLTMLRQTRSQAAEAPPSPRGRAGRRAARQSTAPAVASSWDATRVDMVAVDAVPVVAAGEVPRPPAPPAALPPAPADEAAGEPGVHADQAPEVSQVASPGIAETQVMPAYSGDAGEAAPTREEAALSATAEETSDASEAADSPVADSPAADEQDPLTEPTEAVAADAPPAAEADVDADADADADPDADADEPVAESPPQPTQAPPTAPQAIRYASSAASESAAEYWESEVDPDLAGQVYPVLTSDPDIDTSGYPTSEPRDVETDAPPFATAPFASVPRLNRMRVTPIPPTAEDDED
jgi:hypothetical protein